MKKGFLKAIVILAVFASALFSIAEEPLSVQLERGIYLEETKGDLDAAIGVYQKILEKAEADRTSAAQAQFRLGMCYMKKGKKDDAVKVFEDLVAKYPDQKNLVEKARLQLPPTAMDEEGWARAGKEAIGRGDIIRACDAEMARVMIRKQEGHQYKDKISLDSVYQEYVAVIKPSLEQEKGKWEEVKKYLEQYKGQEEYEWRICNLLSAMARDLGQKEQAERYMDQCLASYPTVDYGEPSKFSKFHHLVNERAGMIWDTRGPEAAENFFLEKLKNDKRCEYFYQPWWNQEYNRRNQNQRLQPFLEKVKEAYQVRMKNFPDKDGYCQRYLKELGVDTGGKGMTKEEVLSQQCDEAMAKGNLVGACEAEMQRVLHRKEVGNVWKDKINLASIYEQYVQNSNPTKEWKEARIKDIEGFLQKHKGDVEYEWRIYHLLGVIKKDLGSIEEAMKDYSSALAAYPEVYYVIPSKYSSYQHIQNEYAGLIWDTKGVEAAENYILNILESDKKFDFFFSGWWSERFQNSKIQDRYHLFLKKVRDSYKKRIINFPQKKPLIEQHLSQLEQEITREEGKIKASLKKNIMDLEMTGLSQIPSPDTESALRFKILFEDGEKPFSLNFVWFQTEPNPDKFCSEALLTSDPSIALAKTIPQEARWIKVYAYRPPPGSAAPLMNPFYDVTFPLDCSKIKSPAEETLILPLGRASVRVKIQPPPGLGRGLLPVFPAIPPVSRSFYCGGGGASGSGRLPVAEREDLRQNSGCPGKTGDKWELSINPHPI